MTHSIGEILGIFLVVVGCGTMVGAAALVSTALAALSAGVFLLMGGVLVVYVSAAMEKAAAKPAQRSGER